MQAAREIVDRGYGKVPDPLREAIPTVFEGMGIEPFRPQKLNDRGSVEPVKREVV